MELAGKKSGFSFARFLRNTLLNLSLILGSLLLTMLLAEFFLRCFPGLLAGHNHAVLNVDPKNRLRFIPNSVSKYHTSEFAIESRANQFGRRGNDWNAEEIANPNNIVFIGDSFVFGYGVGEEFTIPYLLEKHLAKENGAVRVFNFGMPGDIALPEYRQLMEEALQLKFNSKNYIVGIFIGNDFPPPQTHVATDMRAVSPFRYSIKNTKVYQLAKGVVSNSTTLTSWVFNLGKKEEWKVYDSPFNYIYLRSPSTFDESHFMGMLQEMLAMKKVADEHRLSLSFILFPNKIQAENFKEMNGRVYDAEKPNRQITEYCRKHGLSCLDLLPPLKAAYEKFSNPLYFAQDRHFNNAGTTRAAQAILNWVGGRLPSPGKAKTDAYPRDLSLLPR